ncbi:MAG: LysM peptidoglycan-binding domain-containing protein [Ardenticatenaceae bacterium]|nr:LysM peptidoglycan-binding domain-containing protein [Anaerolineales bacterium]MCB8922834.1 LysM peptidoglycan-binding domain-containing protein [Ardenticatenaceae bacterium]
MSEDFESREGTEEPSPRSEWVKFGVLAVIMLGAIAVVALLRPYIFNHIVPAVMGEGMATPVPQEAVPEPVDAAEPGGSAEEAYPIEVIIPLITEEGAAVEVEEAAPAEAEAGYPAPAVEEMVVTEEEGSGEETAVFTIDHVVQPGENLTTIAEKYNLTVQEILDANTIPDPNHIEVGTLLYIPQP